MNIESQLGKIQECLGNQFEFNIGQEPIRINGRKNNSVLPFIISAVHKVDEDSRNSVSQLKEGLGRIEGLFGPYEQTTDIEGSENKTLNTFVKLGKGSFVTFKIVLFPEIGIAEERFKDILDRTGGMWVNK